MDTLTFLGLEPTDDPCRWLLPVRPPVCSSIGALFGGCGLAAGVEAMEQATGRPLIWATAQFLDYARPPEVLDVVVTESVRGHQMSQARATLTTDGREIVTVVGALGTRSLELSGAWAIRPDVPEPEDCPLRPTRRGYRGGIVERIESRVALGRPAGAFPGLPGDGRSALWLRLADLDPGAGLLAVIGDYVPFGISQATGQPVGGSSLDNTLRVVNAESAAGWILADIRLHAVDRGFAHGLVHLWSAGGRLLATAAQSAIVRRWEDHAELVRPEY
jgi:acyl-CoA thioesterase II